MPQLDFLTYSNISLIIVHLLLGMSACFFLIILPAYYRQWVVQKRIELLVKNSYMISPRLKKIRFLLTGPKIMDFIPKKYILKTEN